MPSAVCRIEAAGHGRAGAGRKSGVEAVDIKGQDTPDYRR